MNITKETIIGLFDEARRSQKLRTNLCLHASPLDKVQKMINVLLPGTKVPIHRHLNTDETLAVLYGKILIIYYDSIGNKTDEIFLVPSDISVVDIKKGQWHTVLVTEPVVLLEIKEGPYMPLKEEEIWV